MSIQLVQHTKQSDVEINTIKITLQQTVQLQLETAQTLANLTAQVSELTKNIDVFVNEVVQKQGHYSNRRNKQNRFNNSSRNSYYVTNKSNLEHNKPQPLRTESQTVKEQLDSMLTRLNSLMSYLEKTEGD